MKKIFQCLGTIIISPILAYLLWYLYYWATPYIMSINWFWFWVLFFGNLSLIGISVQIGTFLSLPMAFLAKDNMVAKIINVIPTLIAGGFAICLPWSMDMEYGFLQILLAIVLSIDILLMFGGMIFCPFTIDDEY